MKDFETRRLKKCTGSPTVKLLSKGLELRRQGKDILVFSGGEPDFNSPEPVKAAGIRAIEENLTHYTTSAGMPELRERIGQKLWDENHMKVNPLEEIIVTPGGKLALYQAVMAFLEEGDEAMLLEPNWVSYKEMIQMAGAACVSVPLSIENHFEITAALLERYVSERTKMMVMCNPCNPTGRVFTKAEIDIIADFIESHDLLLISDEIYERLIFDGHRHISIASIDRVKDRVITLNGLSKSHAMTGWRLGYSVASKELTRCMMKLQESTITTTSGISQRAGIAAFDCHEDTKRMVMEYQKRRDFMVRRLNEIPCITCPTPEGAFYLFFKVDYQGMNSFEIADFMLEGANILVAPGDIFGAGGDRCIRFAFSTSMENLEKAVERLSKLFQ